MAFGDDSDSWADAGQWNGPQGWINSSDPATILAAWAELCTSTPTVNANYSPDAVDAVLGFLTGLPAVEGFVAGVIYVVKHLRCTTSGSGSTEGEGDGGEGDVSFALDCTLDSR